MSMMSNIGTMNRKKGPVVIVQFPTSNTYNGYRYYVASKAGGETQVKLKTSYTTTPGISSTTDGWTNTNNMNTAEHPAAQFCRNLTLGGYNDWYLPAKDELMFIYNEFSANYGPLAPEAYATNSFRYPWTSSDYYWSSTEVANLPGYAHILSMREALASGGRFDDIYTVRAIRKEPA